MSALLGLFTIFISSTVSSFLYSDFSSADVVDSNIFYLLGKFLKEGKAPYLEAFDHKGLYIFYYAYLGNLLGGRVGFFFIQAILMSVFYFLLIKALKTLEVYKSIIFFAVLIFLGIYTVSYYSPNDAEPQLPFMGLMLYFYAKAFKGDSRKNYFIANLFAGVLAGVAFNIRASDAMVPFAFVVAYLVYSIKHKMFKDLLYSALFAIGGFVVAYAPSLIHAYSGHFLKEMINASLLSNFTYLGIGGKDQLMVWMSRLVIVLIAAAYFVLLFINRKKVSEDEFIFILVSGVIIFILQIIIAYYFHYLFAILPVLFVFIPHLVNKLFNEEKKWFIYPKFAGLAFAIACSLVYPIKYYSDVRYTNAEINYEINLFISNVDKTSGKVLCVDTNPGIYLVSNITPSYGDFSVQTNHTQVSKLFSYENYLNYLKSDGCKYVITNKNAATNSKSKTTSWFASAEGATYFTKISDERLKLLDIYEKND